MAIRLSGMNSGLDTEAIVSALVSSYSTKKDKYVKAQTKLSWTQDAWKSVNSKVYSLYSSLDSLKYSSGYTTKKTTVSDPTKASVTASSSTFNGTQKLNIIKTAQSGYLTGGKLNSSTSGTTTMAELGFTGSKGQISITRGDGSSSAIDVTQNMTVNDFVNKLKDAGLSANYDSTNQRIYVNSNTTGKDADFNLTGADVNGVRALSALGLNVSSEATSAITDSYAALYNSDTDAMKATIADMANSYKEALSAKNTASAQNANMLSAYGYSAAYSDMKDTLSEISGYGVNTDRLQSYLSMSQNVRNNSIEDAEGNVYTYTGTDDDGNKVYSRDDGAGNLSYITEKTTYDEDGNVTDTSYYATTANTTTETDEDGNEKTKTTYESGASVSGFSSVADNYDDMVSAIQAGMGDEDSTAANEKLSKLSADITTVKSFEGTGETALASDDTYSHTSITAAVHSAYESGGREGVEDVVNGYGTVIAANKETISSAEETLSANSIVSALASYEEGSEEYNTALNDLVDKITAANDIKNSNISGNNDAKKVDGQDAVIKVNGVTYTGSTSSINVNGMTINALAETGDGDENAITINTATDAQGLYDKVKDFLEQYNEVVNEVTKLYNADSARGYEPLTDEQKEAMTDSEVEKWENKIKTSLLRRDSTLGSILNTMTSSMSAVYKINGKDYSLGSFGISTLGILQSEKNQHNAYHIDGDSDDGLVSSKKDKLMAALSEDPDSVIEFMKKLTNGLQTNLNQKMKSTSLRSAYTIYNDKEMASEYSDYTSTIKKWENKVADMEDKYFKRFTAMEKALANLNSNSSSLTGLFG
ncbi:MAG: flagellar filament capping protein FliD [Lachnospiraceae bacterium]|nr:flagellar filament capping protein FliD [Lachnospiraceae bacterium]